MSNDADIVGLARQLDRASCGAPLPIRAGRWARCGGRAYSSLRSVGSRSLLASLSPADLTASPERNGSQVALGRPCSADGAGGVGFGASRRCSPLLSHRNTRCRPCGASRCTMCTGSRSPERVALASGPARRKWAAAANPESQGRRLPGWRRSRDASWTWDSPWEIGPGCETIGASGEGEAAPAAKTRLRSPAPHERNRHGPAMPYACLSAAGSRKLLLV